MARNFIPLVGETFRQMARDGGVHGYTKSELAQSFISAGLLELMENGDSYEAVNAMINMMEMFCVDEMTDEQLLKRIRDIRALASRYKGT